MVRTARPWAWQGDTLTNHGEEVYTLDDGDLMIAADSEECHEGVTRRGEFQPCELPAVALRVDTENGSIYPVCTGHAKPPLVLWSIIAARMFGDDR